ncbi:hypothetical protein QE152_g34373 [Popillia japonica]|uniref:Uncharacterized protein n=1 Tax=Popillia japonica TaxID=7064 RepID=A0AAW1IT94_POPJA
MQRARWLGRIGRMTKDRWVKRVLKTGEGGKRRSGRPRRKLLDEVIRDLKAVGLKDWQNESQDREKWKRRVKELGAKGQ